MPRAQPATPGKVPGPRLWQNQTPSLSSPAHMPVEAGGLEGLCCSGGYPGHGQELLCVLAEGKGGKGNLGSRRAISPSWGSCSHREERGGSHRGTNTETKEGRQRPRKRASNGERRRETHRSRGRGPWGEAVLKGPAWAGAGKKEETKNKRRKTKGQWESVPPHPSLPEIWGCRGDCLQGSGPWERVGPGLKGQRAALGAALAFPLA